MTRVHTATFGVFEVVLSAIKGAFDLGGIGQGGKCLEGFCPTGFRSEGFCPTVFSTGTYVKMIMTQGTYVWRDYVQGFMCGASVRESLSGGLMTGWL